ncbi:MAG TPA: 23S rRNA (adenine(2503)-C(2))-methyltransferase RlmN [Acidobacteriota bacterium]|nr:23S rRNA (adenine(2503)-C(2))-methyltransferase RlmN [Acidobacteriota bacterium]
MNKNNLVGLSCDELIALAARMGERPFRGKQLYNQIYRRKVLDIGSMTDLSKDFRRRLGEECAVGPLEVERRWQAADGTIKFLFRLDDGQRIESVYIPEEKRDTLCISSQVGCDVGCTFCLTAQMGFRRNLTPGEIVGQVLTCIHQGVLPENGFNVVFMGMGEPLYNYRNVMKAFRLFTDQDGMDLSRRKITVSTAGVVPVMKKMLEEEQLPKLAVSLNSTTEEMRSHIMPINRKWNMKELLDACRKLARRNGQRVTFEYVLLAGETDREEDALRLIELLQGMRAKVNLIPYNPNPGLPHRRPTQERVGDFQRLLVDNRISAFVRRTRGDDVSAACGQLAHLKEAAVSAPS